MLIDKMDQKKTVCPTVWSQLATPLFKDLDRRMIAGLNGSMWFGTLHTTHHLRTVFNDTGHGAEMQCSTILQNLHDIAIHEGHLPECFTIGADNTRKETKNQITMWFLIWLLCTLQNTVLSSVEVMFLLVGHTHNKVDRFFSRIAVALAGRDYFTVPGMLAKVQHHLRYCETRSGHLGQTWKWKDMLNLDKVCPMHNLDPVHHFKFSRSNGIYMQWKQWCTDDGWTKPLLVLHADAMCELEAFRPEPNAMQFPNEQVMLDWVDRFESWCAGHPSGEYKNLHAECAWLRAAISHTAPGVYAPGLSVNVVIEALQNMPGQRPDITPTHAPTSLPPDIITQLFPGADIVPIPAESLVRIEGITHTKGGKAIRSAIICPGSLLVVRVQGTVVHKQHIPFLVATAVETSSRHWRHKHVAVVWHIPQLAKMETFRSGKKRQMLDVFGPWTPVDIAPNRDCTLPTPLVLVEDILECNFEWTAEGTMPYDIFDCLRRDHEIDVTGLSTSLTHRGNLYRSYALLRGQGAG